MINVALCFSDPDWSYYKHAGVTMLSILENTTHKVCFHIVSNDMPIKIRQNLDMLIKKYNAEITYYNSELLDMNDIQPFLKKLSLGTFYRLHLHNLIQNDKVLYLDCDIICNLDIAEVYDSDLTNRMCAAVVDGGIEKHIEKMNFNKETYFNAGVMLLNLSWLRKNKIILENCTKRLAQIPRIASFGDQDIFNMVAKQCGYHVVKYLDQKYNYYTALHGRAWLDNNAFQKKIVHMTGPKPWKDWSNSSIQYWKYYKLCPWGEDAFESMSKLKINPESLFMSSLPAREKKFIRRVLDIRRLGILGFLAKRIKKSI